jgi:hypothetical protein
MFGLPQLNSDYKNKAKLCVERWEEDGALVGLPSRSKRDREIREATSVMLENQYLQIEQAATSTGSDDIAVFRRIALPMVRRYFPQLIAHHLVGVQPMTGPQALIYYMRFRAGITKGNQPGVDNAAGDVKWTNTGADATSGWDNTSLQQKADGSVVLPIYYSHQRVYRETTPALAGGAGTRSYQLAKTPVLTNSVQAGPTDVADIPTLTLNENYTAFGKIYDGAVLTGYFRIIGTTVTVTAVIGPAITPTSATFTTDGLMAITWSADPGADTEIRNVVYEYNMECQSDLPRVTLVIEDHTIKAKIRKLRADWTNEAAQDIRAQHNVEVETEFTQFMSEQINLEVDREIVEDLRANAGTIGVWDFATALGDTAKEKQESLYIKIVEVSNQIHKKTLRAEANFIVTSPEIAVILSTATAGFAAAPTDGWESNVGMQFLGTINSRYRLFKDPNFPRDQILLGFRGDSSYDVGYYYCPYVALVQSGTLVDPQTGCPTKIMMTRYAKVMLREGPRYFGRISVLNFFL